MKNTSFQRFTLIIAFFLISIPFRVNAMGTHMQLIDVEEEENTGLAYIMAKFPGKKEFERATGFPVGRNCVATSAHTFLNERGEAAEQVIIVFGMKQTVVSKCCGCRKQKIFKDHGRAIINSPLFVVPREYSDSPHCSEFDVGLITLNSFTPAELQEAGIYAPWYKGGPPVQMSFPEINFAYGTTSFTLADAYVGAIIEGFEEEDLQNAPIIIKGYPEYSSADRRLNKVVYNAFSTPGIITEVRDNIFFHDCLTAKGLSGAPVYLEGSVCGIHSGAFATRFSPTVADFFTATLGVLDNKGPSSLPV